MQRAAQSLKPVLLPPVSAVKCGGGNWRRCMEAWVLVVVLAGHGVGVRGV